MRPTLHAAVAPETASSRKSRSEARTRVIHLARRAEAQAAPPSPDGRGKANKRPQRRQQPASQPAEAKTAAVTLTHAMTPSSRSRRSDGPRRRCVRI